MQKQKMKSSLRHQVGEGTSGTKGTLEKSEQCVSTKNDEVTSGPLRSRSNRSVADPRSTWQSSSPPRIIQLGTLEHRCKTPSVQWARPFRNTQMFLFYLKNTTAFLSSDLNHSSQWKSSKSDKSTSLSTFGVGFSRQGESKNPFFKMWGTKTLFHKTFNFVDTSKTSGDKEDMSCKWSCHLTENLAYVQTLIKSKMR